MKKITTYLPLLLGFCFILIAAKSSAQICGLNAAFSYTQGVSGQVNFSSTSTNTVAGTTYTWNYGDATYGTGPISSHTYATNGYYNVVLIANNNFTANCVDSVIIPVMVSTYPCTLAAGFNYTLGANGLVSFNSVSTGTDSGTTYTWTLGDNNTNYGDVTNHVYGNGTYTVILKAMSSLTTCISTATQVISVSNATCNLNTSFSFTQGANGLVSFNSTSTGTVPSTTYLWSFGDSSPSGSGPSTSHTYSANGTYFVYLYANNNYSIMCADSSLIIPIVVNSFSPCTLNANYNFAQGANGQVTFTSTSTGTIAASIFYWQFGDATTANGNPTSHTYTMNGAYSATLTVYNNSLTCFSSITKIINVSTVPCGLIANYTHTVSSGGNVNFANASTGTSTNTNYFWDFGDGFTSVSQSPSHTYASSGAYNVYMSASGSSCIDSVIQSINVTGIPCIANSNFTMAPTTTTLVWNATPVSPWNVVAATWNWGDNSTTNTLYTSHTYSASGNYSICLSVTVSCGANSTSCLNQFVYKTSGSENAQMIYINVIPPASTPLGIIDNAGEILDWSVYPNPNNGRFEIKLDAATNGIVKIKVYSLIGEMIYETEIDTINKTIDLNNISNGVYFIKLNSNNKEFTKKVIINK
ncbi:MAG: PKD domain-containing protein [Bacteroidetes bacterium]|nr:PKD domain-containing protein [Bacteroidota bacterium]